MAATKSKGAMSAMDRIAAIAATKPKSKGKKEKVRVDLEGIDDAIKQFIDAKRAEQDAKARKETAEDAICSAAMPVFRRTLRRLGRLESSALINGLITITQKCMFSKVPATAEPELVEAFGDDFDTYFVPAMEIKLKEDAATNEAILEALMGAFDGEDGRPMFAEVFDVARWLKPTDTFFGKLMLDPATEEVAAPFIDSDIIKPYKPSLRVA